MQLDRYKLKDGQQVWACAYTTNNTEKSMAYKCKPVLGIIDLKSGFNSGTFYELGSRGKIKKSSGVSLFARHFSNTEEESIELYNNLIKAQINFAKKLVEKHKSNLI